MSCIFTPLCMADNTQPCNWAAVNQERFSEILTMIDSRVEDNYDRIKTWQGKVNMVFINRHKGENVKRFYDRMLVDKPLPNEVIDHVELKRKFALDGNKGLQYESVYPDAQQYVLDTQTGNEIQLNERVQINSGTKILTPTYQIISRERKDRDGVIVARRTIKQKRPAGMPIRRSNLPPVFDPRDTMRIFGDINEETFAPLGGTFAKQLKYFDKQPLLDGHPTITVKECVLGDVKKYKISLITLTRGSDGETIPLFFNLVCSSEMGFNVVSYSLTDAEGKKFEEKTFEYELFNDVYLPVRKDDLNFDHSTGNLIKHNSITFYNEKVNKPIPEETFGYQNLGLENGDRFIDRISDKTFAYKNGELIEVAEND